MKTTLNVRKVLLYQIKGAAESKGISCSEVITFLLKQIMAEIENPGNLGKMVRYQDRSRKEEWHRFHVQVREDVYEYWLDLRKLLKMSVSLILANAVKKYLKGPLKTKTSDNYLFTNYIIAKEVIDSVIVWKLIWGFPYHLDKLWSH